MIKEAKITSSDGMPKTNAHITKTSINEVIKLIIIAVMSIIAIALVIAVLFFKLPVRFVGIMVVSYLPILFMFYIIGSVRQKGLGDDSNKKNDNHKTGDLRQSLKKLWEYHSILGGDELPIEFTTLLSSLDDVVPLIRESNGNHAAYVLRQTILDYLPNTLNSYSILSKDYRMHYVLDDRRTPQQNFAEQIMIINNGVQEIIKGMNENNAQKMLINERFLLERFGSGQERNSEVI